MTKHMRIHEKGLHKAPTLSAGHYLPYLSLFTHLPSSHSLEITCSAALFHMPQNSYSPSLVLVNNFGELLYEELELSKLFVYIFVKFLSLLLN